MAKTRKPTLHVVIVGDHRTTGDLIESGLSTGQFAAFIGTSQSTVIAKAREESRRWGVSRVDGQPYRLLVGQITGAVIYPPDYKLESL